MSLTTVTKVPKIFQLELASVCNLRCTMCPYPIHTRAKELMDIELFKTIIDRDSNPGDIIGFHILGESLLHPEVFTAIKYAKAQGVKVELATNGTKLDSLTSWKLIEAGLDAIWLSFDGATKKTYEKIRVGANFDQVRKNVSLFLTTNSNLGNPVRTTIQMVGQPDNKGEGDIFHEMWAPFTDGERVVSKVKFLDTWAGTLFEEIKQPDFERFACPEPFNRVAVLANGDVVPCCRDWNGKLVYGNLKEQSLQDIWENSLELLNLRSVMKSGKWDELPEPCKSCKEWYIPMDRAIGTPKEVEEELEKRGIL